MSLTFGRALPHSPSQPLTLSLVSWVSSFAELPDSAASLNITPPLVPFAFEDAHYVASLRFIAFRLRQNPALIGPYVRASRLFNFDGAYVATYWLIKRKEENGTVWWRVEDILHFHCRTVSDKPTWSLALPERIPRHRIIHTLNPARRPLLNQLYASVYDLRTSYNIAPVLTGRRIRRPTLSR